jgi:hypothetical protein
MKQSTLAMASVTVFLLFGGLLYPAPAHSPGEAPSAAISSESPVLDMGTIEHAQRFNLESCETNCRSYYGIPPYIEEQQAGGGGSGFYPRYLIIAHCIEQCQKRFWKEFEKEMKGLDRSSPQ